MFLLITSRKRQPVRWEPGEVSELLWSPDGSTLIVLTETREYAFGARSGFYNARAEEDVADLRTADDTFIPYLSDHDEVSAVAVDPQRETLALGLPEGKIELREARSDRYIWTLYGHEREVYAVSFSPEEYTLASASMDGTVRVWDTYTGRLIQIIEGYGAGD